MKIINTKPTLVLTQEETEILMKAKAILDELTDEDYDIIDNIFEDDYGIDTDNIVTAMDTIGDVIDAAVVAQSAEAKSLVVSMTAEYLIP